MINLDETKTLIEQLPLVFNWVLLDSPPLLFAADANLLSTICDGTVLVVRIGVTTIDSVTRAMQSLCENNVLGIVANGARAGELYSKYTYYYSSYYYKEKKGSQGGGGRRRSSGPRLPHRGFAGLAGGSSGRPGDRGPGRACSVGVVRPQFAGGRPGGVGRSSKAGCRLPRCVILAGAAGLRCGGGGVPAHRWCGRRRGSVRTGGAWRHEPAPALPVGSPVWAGWYYVLDQILLRQCRSGRLSLSIQATGHRRVCCCSGFSWACIPGSCGGFRAAFAGGVIPEAGPRCSVGGVRDRIQTSQTSLVCDSLLKREAVWVRLLVGAEWKGTRFR